jgi:hypothetical protein
MCTYLTVGQTDNTISKLLCSCLSTNNCGAMSQCKINFIICKVKKKFGKKVVGKF